MGRYDQTFEVSVCFVLPEATSEVTWDVRYRLSPSAKFRLWEVDSTDIADPLTFTPALGGIEHLVEKWLKGVGCQLELPFP